MIKGKRRDEDTGEDIQDNNGTKMATASAMGRPPASKPLRRPEEPWMTSRCIHSPYSKRMTTSMTYWNYQANLSHHYRWASTWEKRRVPREHPHRRDEEMQTPPMKVLAGKSNPETSCCEVQITMEGLSTQHWTETRSPEPPDLALAS